MTWTLKIRSSPGALMAAEYECPVHGRFDAIVPRDTEGNPPESAVCPVDGVIGFPFSCARQSPFVISMPAVHTQFVVSASQGKPAPKPHPHALDTRPLAEGQRKKFREDRRQIRRELRHQRLKEYLK